MINTKNLSHRKDKCSKLARLYGAGRARAPEEAFYRALVLFMAALATSPRPEVVREATRWLPVFEERRRHAARMAARAEAETVMVEPEAETVTAE